MGLKPLKALWQTDRSYLLMVGAVAFLPWVLSGVVAWFVAGYILPAAHTEAFRLLFFTATVFTMAVGLTPTTLIATLSGFLFGWSGFPWVVLTYTAAAILGRGLGIWLNRFFTGSTRFTHPAANEFFSRLEDSPFWLLVFCRLSPVLSFALTNVVLGRMRFKTVSFGTATLLGMLPRTALFFYTGTLAAAWSEALRHGENPLSRMLWLLLFLAVSLWGMGVIVRQALAKLGSVQPSATLRR